MTTSPSRPRVNRGRPLHLSIAVLLIAVTFIFQTQTSHAKRRKKRAPKQERVYIPIETIDALKANDIEAAVRAIRLEADSPRTQYLLTIMQRIVIYEKKEKKLPANKHGELFNLGIAYHNLFLFLKGIGHTNDEFFKSALDYYRKASRTISPSRKNETRLMTAALYAANEDYKRAKKYFHKVEPDLYQDEFRWYTSLALYYAALGDTDQTIVNLKEAYTLKPDYLKFWLGICDDFINLYNEKDFNALLAKWKVKLQNRGHGG